VYDLIKTGAAGYTVAVFGVICCLFVSNNLNRQLLQFLKWWWPCITALLVKAKYFSSEMRSCCMVVAVWAALYASL
jgi:hypothetical protein